MTALRILNAQCMRVFAELIDNLGAKKPVAEFRVKAPGYCVDFAAYEIRNRISGQFDALPNARSTGDLPQ